MKKGWLLLLLLVAAPLSQADETSSLFEEDEVLLTPRLPYEFELSSLQLFDEKQQPIDSLLRPDPFQSFLDVVAEPELPFKAAAPIDIPADGLKIQKEKIFSEGKKAELTKDGLEIVEGVVGAAFARPEDALSVTLSVRDSIKAAEEKSLLISYFAERLVVEPAEIQIEVQPNFDQAEEVIFKLDAGKRPAPAIAVSDPRWQNVLTMARTPTPTLVVQMADGYQAAGLLPVAREEIRWGLKRFPLEKSLAKKLSALSVEEGRYHLQRGEAFKSNGLLKPALVSFDKAVKVDPGNSRAVRLKEETSQELSVGAGRHDRVARDFQSGVDRFNQGQWDRALESFVKVLNLDPTHKGALVYIEKLEEKLANRTEEIQ